MIIDSTSDNEIKTEFFSAVKNQQLEDVVRYFRDSSIEPWNFREEDEYTGR